MSMEMIRGAIVQGMTAVQNVHDARLCELINQLRGRGFIDAEESIDKLLELRRDMMGDTVQLQDDIRTWRCS